MYQTIPKPRRESRSLRFLYHTRPGRVCLRAATTRTLSSAAGAFLVSRMSAPMIKGFVRTNHIRVSDFEDRKYHSYNDFFTRRINPGLRPIDQTPGHLISPCDGKLSVYPIHKNSSFHIKGGDYTVAELLHNHTLAKKFSGGTCLVFRLAVDDYHRYCYFDDGSKGRNYFIQGRLHTVRDIAQERYTVFKQNCREYTVMNTKHFGLAVQIEVGAMIVGRISNLHGIASFRRGDEKGKFEFGGSTIVLLLQKDAAVIAPEILKATEKDLETVIRMGECIGTRGPGARTQNN
ncbi:MAG: phosphatidylserine decarboxylase [Clostridia bacterium]|nr:phosphatidylserine decarboxylase [Clostridia bacterium]